MWDAVAKRGTTTALGVITLGAAGSLVGATVWALGRSFYQRAWVPFAAGMDKIVAANEYRDRCVESQALREPLLAVAYTSAVAARASFYAILGSACCVCGAGLLLLTHAVLLPTLVTSAGTIFLIHSGEHRVLLTRLANTASRSIRDAATKEFERSWSGRKAAPDTVVTVERETIGGRVG